MRRVLVIACLAGCGDNLRAVPFDEYPAEELAARCRFWVRCGLVGSEEQCAQFSQPRADPDVVAAVDAGFIKWDAERAQLCIDWYDSLDCDPTTEHYRYAPCFPLYLGTKRDGEACAFGYECISRECWLEGAECSDACCTGYCAGDTPPVRGGIGDRCRYAPCREGFCEDSLCVPLRGEGEACAGSSECEIGLSCDWGTCKLLPALGESCTHACRDVGQQCDGFTARCARVLLQGERCYVDDECSPFYECSTTKSTCQLIGGGGSCGVLKQGNCALPYVCDYMADKCSAPKPDGAACSSGVECASYSCNFETRACTSDLCF
ncbi:MAG TPA: hypothetical protein VIV11_12060 [Kofleriaceae bacterium]